MPERCAGLDVPKKTVGACVLMPDGQGDWRQEPRTFGPLTAALLALADGLLACGCTHGARARTGDDWKPVVHLLEGPCEVVLVKAHHVKAVPGRKTAVQEAAWRAARLPHGWWRASFSPPVAHRERRDLTR